MENIERQREKKLARTRADNISLKILSYTKARQRRPSHHRDYVRVDLERKKMCSNHPGRRSLCVFVQLAAFERNLHPYEQFAMCSTWNLIVNRSWKSTDTGSIERRNHEIMFSDEWRKLSLKIEIWELCQLLEFIVDELNSHRLRLSLRLPSPLWSVNCVTNYLSSFSWVNRFAKVQCRWVECNENIETFRAWIRLEILSKTRNVNIIDELIRLEWCKVDLFVIYWQLSVINAVRCEWISTN